jgi:hypothetical protein
MGLDMCVLRSVKNEYVDNNSITEQTGLYNFCYSLGQNDMISSRVVPDESLS